MRPWFLGPHPPSLCLTVKGQSEIHKKPTTKWRGTSVQTRGWQTGVPVGKIWPTAHVYKQNFIRTPPPASIHVLSEAVLHVNAELSNYKRNRLPLKAKNIFYLDLERKKERSLISVINQEQAVFQTVFSGHWVIVSWLWEKKKIGAHRQWSEEAFQNLLKWEGLIGDGGNYSRGLQSLCCKSFLVYIGVNKEAEMVCVQHMNREKRERVLTKYCHWAQRASVHPFCLLFCSWTVTVCQAIRICLRYHTNKSRTLLFKVILILSCLYHRHFVFIISPLRERLRFYLIA